MFQEINKSITELHLLHGALKSDAFCLSKMTWRLVSANATDHITQPAGSVIEERLQSEIKAVLWPRCFVGFV